MTPAAVLANDLPRASREHAEQTLLARVAARDARAFDAIYGLCSRPVYSLALSILNDPQAAQDVTQDVFLAIWRGAEDFDASRGQARSWILSLAHHKSVDAIRRRRARAGEPLDDALPSHTDVMDEAMRAVEGTRVRLALARLSPIHRQAILLAYYGGFTQQEIAARLGLPLGTVKTRTRDGLLRLRALLDGEGPAAAGAMDVSVSPAAPNPPRRLVRRVGVRGDEARRSCGRGGEGPGQMHVAWLTRSPVNGFEATSARRLPGGD